MKECDIAVGSLPWNLVRNAIATAMEVGSDYVEFSLNVETMDEFRKLGKECKRAGITALTSMGEDPGMSDVFARRGANILDTAEEAQVFDGDNSTLEGHDFFSVWSPEDMLEEATVPAAIYENGKHIFVPPLSRKSFYDFPEPVGRLPVYNTMHEETFLMPAFIDGIKNAGFRIAIDDNFAAAANMLRKLGMASKNELDVKGRKVRPIDVVVATMPRPVEFAGKLTGASCIVTEVIGKKDGKRTKVRLWTAISHKKAYELCKSNATGYLVGTGGALGAEMIIDGVVHEKGLFVPEQLPAEDYISRMERIGLKVHEEVARL
jgi:saccharopine dehydrogenase-like NADP-dependent oxidoreductase